jgi:hypothetical protein
MIIPRKDNNLNKVSFKNYSFFGAEFNFMLS